MGDYQPFTGREYPHKHGKATISYTDLNGRFTQASHTAAALYV